MLTISNVSKTYPKSSVKAVDNLNLEVRDGEIFGFLGPNGAGKSTTIKLITGILNADEGVISVGGMSISDNRLEAKKFIGYVSDNHAVYEKLTGREYLDFMGTMFDVPANLRRERAEKLLEEFGLTKAANDQIGSYSHGMKQKIVVVGSLLHDPKLWILDEPLTGLDPASAFQLKKIMRSRADEGKTVFFSSHVIDVVEKVCDRVGIINNGRLVAVDTLDSIKSNPDISLEKVFLDITNAGGEFNP